MSRSLLHMALPLLLLAMVGCQGSRPLAMATTIDVRSHVTIQKGGDGALNWEELITSLDGADVIIIGEMHDDAVGHGVQLAIIEDVLARTGDGVVAMEMLERDEQILVDDYIDGHLDADAFAKKTASASWSGPGSWAAWYQPIIDATIAQGGHVIAANAPRRYVTLARVHGRDGVNRLSPERRVLVDVPERPHPESYRRRFIDAMGNHQPDGSVIDAFFLAQRTWDTTMAHSVTAAGPRPDRPVILLVGQFHSNYQGGVTASLRQLLGEEARIITVTMIPIAADAFEEGDPAIVGDHPIADIVIYTDDAR